jgi:hypothetical protein
VILKGGAGDTIGLRKWRALCSSASSRAAYSLRYKPKSRPFLLEWPFYNQRFANNDRPYAKFLLLVYVCGKEVEPDDG